MRTMLRAGDLDYSELHFFRKGGGRASSFCWLTGPGN